MVSFKSKLVRTSIKITRDTIIYHDFSNFAAHAGKRNMSIVVFAVADPGGPRGPGPPLRESKKMLKGPINGTFCGGGHGKEKMRATTPPPTPNRVGFRRPRKIARYYPPPPNRVGFWRSRKNYGTTPPPPPPH